MFNHIVIQHSKVQLPVYKVGIKNVHNSCNHIRIVNELVIVNIDINHAYCPGPGFLLVSSAISSNAQILLDLITLNPLNFRLLIGLLCTYGPGDLTIFGSMFKGSRYSSFLLLFAKDMLF